MFGWHTGDIKEINVKGGTKSRFEPNAGRMKIPETSVQFITNSICFKYYICFLKFSKINNLPRVSSANT